MRLLLCVLGSLALCAQALVLVPAAPVVSRATSHTLRLSEEVSMTSANKKAKAAQRKQKSCRAAAKRFKVTGTGKLLRHYAGKAHLLRKKRPQHLAKLRRVGQCADAELDTYQKLLLVKPKRQ
jgi:large subunit ribosomal protein L35